MFNAVNFPLLFVPTVTNTFLWKTKFSLKLVDKEEFLAESVLIHSNNEMEHSVHYK